MTSRPPSDAADADLLHRVAHGDRAARDAAFHELTARHRDRVYAICHRYFRNPTDAEDATQETFLTVLRRAATFRGEAKVSTWLYRVAVNTCHDLARRRARRPQTPVEDIGLVSDLRGEVHSDEEQLAAMALSDLLSEALTTLDEETRGLLLLCVVEGLPYAEVAEAYGIAVGTVKSRVHRARAKLVDLLGDVLDDEEGPGRGPGRPGQSGAGTDAPPSVRGPPG